MFAGIKVFQYGASVYFGIISNYYYLDLGRYFATVAVALYVVIDMALNWDDRVR